MASCATSVPAPTDTDSATTNTAGAGIPHGQAHAIAVVSRFKRLLEPQDLIIRADHTGQVVVSYEWTHAEDAPPQVLVDAELAFLVEVSRRGTRCPDLSPRELH